MQFTNQSMQEIIDELRTEIDLLEAGDMITFKELDPDEGGTYAGESITIEEKEYIYRGYKSWVSLAELLKCKMHTPQSGDYPFITLHFEKLQDKSFHGNASDVYIQRTMIDHLTVEFGSIQLCLIRWCVK